MLCPADKVQAGDGTWNTTTSGALWGTPGNWVGGTATDVADGSGFTANFNTLDITAPTTVTLDSARTIGNLIFGDTTTSTAASWTLSGANTLTLAGTTPTITVNTLGTGATVTISTVISGSNGLTKAGAGTLLLSGTGASTYTGGINVNAGTLTISGTGAQTGVLGAGAITIASGATLRMTAGSSYTLSNSLNGSGTLHLNNLGQTATISTDNSATYSGQVRVERMTVAVGHNGALGTGSILLGVNDQPSGIRSTDTTTRTLANALAFTGSAASTYNLGSTNALVNGNLTFTDTSAIALGGINKRLQVHNRTQFAAGFSGTGGITMQTGVGTLVLNGINTYTGATTINSGTMLINNSLSAGSAVTVGTGGTLGGNGTVGGATSIIGKLAAGDSVVDSTDSLAFGSSLTLAGTAESIFDIDGTTEGTLYDAVDVTGALTYGGVLTLDFGFTPTVGTEFNLFDFASQSGTFSSINVVGVTGIFDYTDGTFTVVPEPSATILLVAGAGLFFTVRRKRRAC